MPSRRLFLGAVLGSIASEACHPGTDRGPLHATGSGPGPAADDGFELVDLTHVLAPSSPYIEIPNATFPFRRTPIATIQTRQVYANRWELTEHIGTHVDAPCHFAEHGRCLEALPVADFFTEAAVIDLQARAAIDPDAELTLADLAAWEAANGPFPDRCAVLMRSGWEERWPSQARFANADAHDGMHFPGFSRAAVERLAAMPQVLGIGVDTLSIDPGRDTHYEGHHVWAAADKWALECLANLSRLPPRGARIFAGALRVESASGSPARVIAWVPQKGKRT